jgi:sulfur carrier protein
MIKVNGEEMTWRGGMTAQDILDEKNFTFRMIAVWINGEPVERGGYSAAAVPDGADVEVLHMISGG